MAWIKCFNTFTCDALLHTADSTPSTQRCLFFVTPPIVCRTLWKACSVLFQLGYCINVSSSAWMPEGLWMPVGLIPADQWDCPCLETAHTTTLFLPCLLSRPEADQTSGTAACEAAFPTSYFHRLFGKIHLELIRAEGFSENGTGNALSDSRSHTLNGNLNKKHPHHCALSLSLSLSNLHTPAHVFLSGRSVCGCIYTSLSLSLSPYICVCVCVCVCMCACVCACVVLSPFLHVRKS